MGPPDGGGGMVVQGHYRDFDDYASPSGTVLNSGATDQGFLARADHEIGPGVLSASWQSDFGRNIDRPRNNSQTVRFYYPIEDSHRLTAGYDLRQAAGFERLGVNAFFGRYRQMTDQDRFATPTRGRSLERSDYTADDFQVRGSAERLFSRSRVEFGVDVNGRFNVHALDFVTQYSVAGDVTSRVENVSIDTATRRDTGAYAVIETALAPKVTAGAGVRGDYVTSKNRGGYFGDHATSHGAMSGSASMTVGPWEGMTLTGQVGSGFRDPTVSDRYYRGPTGRGFITGNPDLDPERSVQFDVGLRYTSARVRAGLFGFQYRINDLIERYQTATDYFFFRNRGRARIRGIELEVQAVLGAQLTLESTAAVTGGRALDDGTALDDVPPATFTLAVRRPVTAKGFAQVRAAFFGVDDRPGPTEIRMPGYTLVDVTGGFALAKRVDVNVMLRNLLNQTFPVSPDARAVPAPGINAVLTVTARF